MKACQKVYRVRWLIWELHVSPCYQTPNQLTVQIPNLINSPPYILDILPDIHNHIRLIINEQHSRFDLLTDNDYFQTFISNLAEKLKYLQKVLRNAKGKVQTFWKLIHAEFEFCVDDRFRSFEFAYELWKEIYSKKNQLVDGNWSECHLFLGKTVINF